MPNKPLSLFLLVLLAVCSSSAALADYYKYTDASGSVNITNKLESVPQKYRSRVKVIKDETLSKQDPGARKQQTAPAEEAAPGPEAAAPAQAQAQAQAPQGKFAELCARFVWLKPLLYVVGVLGAFLAVMWTASAIPSPLLSKLIYLGFFIGVFIFLYKAYADHLVNDSIAVKEKAVNMMKKANQREIPQLGEEPAQNK